MYKREPYFEYTEDNCRVFLSFFSVFPVTHVSKNKLKNTKEKNEIVPVK
jgi:hypothetical protein